MAATRLSLGLFPGLSSLVLLLGGCTEAMPEDSGSGGGGGVVGGDVGGSSAGAAGSSSLPLGGSGAGTASGGASAGGAPVAGAGGAAGNAGTGTGGAAGAASDPGAQPSAGCGKAATQALETFVEAHVTAKGFDRQYFVRLPTGYDPQRAYTTVVVGAACGGKGDNGISIQDASKNNAIVVGLSPSQEVAGRDCFMTESPTSPEIDFFDAALAAVETNFCVDQSRVFMEGFSSGSWLTNLIGCARGDVLRGQGNASGGPPPLPMCKGPIATIMVHDMGDGANSYDGGKQTRDRIRQLNGCMDQTAPWDAAYPECVAYQGCPAAFPLVFCTTTGMGHSENKPFSTEGFWKFWSALPPKP
jgi:poly(3-hydroxybutyrate) depolymerase